MEFLFIAPIFPSTWESIGKSEFDVNRRQIEVNLKKSAEKFAISRGFYSEFKKEHAIPPVTDNQAEWNRLLDATDPPVHPNLLPAAENLVTAGL